MLSIYWFEAPGDADLLRQSLLSQLTIKRALYDKKKPDPSA